MSLFNVEERPGHYTDSIEDVDGFFASNYVFASKHVAGKVVLDTGSGTGYGANLLAKSGAQSVVGVDINTNVIEKCRVNYNERKNLSFQVCRKDKLEFDDESFDIIISFEVIEHIVDYQNYLKDIHRVLKKGGKLILSTPNKNIYSPGLANPIITCHVKEFLPEEFQELLSCVFSDVEMYGKHIINEQFLAKENEYKSSLRYALTKKLAQLDFIRKISAKIPYYVRGIISKSESCHLMVDDCRITKENLATAMNLLAVCEK